MYLGRNYITCHYVYSNGLRRFIGTCESYLNSLSLCFTLSLSTGYNFCIVITTSLHAVLYLIQRVQRKDENIIVIISTRVNRERHECFTLRCGRFPTRKIIDYYCGSALRTLYIYMCKIYDSINKNDRANDNNNKKKNQLH